MSSKLEWFRLKVECCLTCKFIDEYALNIADEGEEPFGYDGAAICGKYDPSKEKSDDNCDWVSPLWKACKQYERCTEGQASYLDIYSVGHGGIIENPHDTSKIKQ